MLNTKRQVTELLEEKQYEYAIYVCTNAIDEAKEKGRKTKELSDAYLLRSSCYSAMQKYLDSINDIQEALNVDKTNVLAYKKLSKCYLRIGNTKQAKQAMVDLLGVARDKSDIEYGTDEKKNLEVIIDREIKAQEAFRNKQYDKVVKLMDECLEKSEICVRHKLFKAECLIYLQDFDQSLKVVNEILFNSKNEDEAIYLRGMSLLHQEKYKLGLEDLRHIILDCPKGKKLYDRYKDVEKCLSDARILRRTDVQKAKENYEAILEMDSKNLLQRKRMYFELAQISIDQQNFQQSLIYCENILIIDKNDINGLKLRAKINMELQEFEDAIEDYTKLVTLQNTTENRNLFYSAKASLQRNKTDHYKILGVRIGATNAEITKARNILALQYHPDKLAGKSEAEQKIGTRKFKKIQEAYEKLLKQK